MCRTPNKNPTRYEASLCIIWGPIIFGAPVWSLMRLLPIDGPVVTTWVHNMRETLGERDRNARPRLGGRCARVPALQRTVHERPTQMHSTVPPSPSDRYQNMTLNSSASRVLTPNSSVIQKLTAGSRIVSKEGTLLVFLLFLFICGFILK
jgi:hypothetical protein